MLGIPAVAVQQELIRGDDWYNVAVKKPYSDCQKFFPIAASFKSPLTPL
jgi:hypothetical protein